MRPPSAPPWVRDKWQGGLGLRRPMRAARPQLVRGLSTGRDEAVHSLRSDGPQAACPLRRESCAKVRCPFASAFMSSSPDVLVIGTGAAGLFHASGGAP